MLGVASVLAGCKKPQPPQLTPKSAKVIAVDLAGIDLRVLFDAYNPNAYDLSVRRVSAHVVVDGKLDLGTVTADQPMSLPAGQRIALEVPLQVRWNGATALAAVGASRRSVPYEVDGIANVGGETLNLDVPFKMKGEITQQQLVNVTLKSLGNIPGLAPPR
ncbi:MAG: LEA type 2 family protein [Deltaproteobacteria bacterium]|nr:LEA type 2 family protein [Deltaproteobacteria bacterium]